MTKESLYTPETRRLIKRFTFNDEQTLRRNGGIPTDVTFTNGVGEFNGTSSKIQLNKPFKGTVSIRIIFKSVTPVAGKYIVDFRTNGGTGYVYFNTGITFIGSTGTRYVDGVASDAVSNNSKELVVTGIPIDNNSGYIGCLNSGSSNFITADYDLIEIYNYTLTAEEVSNIYEKRRFRDLGLRAGITEIVNISAQSGSIIDRQKNVLTLSSMNVFKDGDIRAMLFDGADSKVDCGDIVFYTFDTTFICWMKPYSLGESEGGRLFDNGKLIIYIRTATNYISIFTNSTLKSSGPNAFIFNKWHLFVITVTVLGIVNIYMNGILSGAADQDCGATVVGTTNLFIGNNDVGNSTFDGPLNDSRIHKGILTAQEISQLFSNERIKYQV